jgi:dihydrodipicolinate synthase/N-acetylneuraminate lyase
VNRPNVVVALLTPHGNPTALRDHVEFLVDAGVDALMPCGTTGEGPLLSTDEAAALVHATVEAASGRVPVWAHVGRPDTRSTAALARRAIGDGAQSVSAVVPYYYEVSDGQLERHYHELLAAAGDVPAYAYTIPARTGNELSPDVVRRLAAAGLSGVKDSTKSWERHLEYLECGVDVLVGTDAMVVDSFRAGSAGCVSALANVRPDLLCRARDGADVQDEISALRGELPFPALKAAVADRVPGYPIEYRAPLG